MELDEGKDSCVCRVIRLDNIAKISFLSYTDAVCFY